MNSLRFNATRQKYRSESASLESAVTSGQSATAALAGSTETEQFHLAHK